MEKFPQEKKGIQGFIADAVGVSEETEKLFEEGQLTTLKKVSFPLRFPRLWAARKKTMADYMNEYTTNPSLRSVMSVFCGYFGLPPSKLSGFFYMTRGRRLVAVRGFLCCRGFPGHQQRCH